MTRPARPFPTIASPCTERWEGMTPVPGGRHCATCALSVVDLTELTEGEARDRVTRAEGRMCVRMRATAAGAPVFRKPRAGGRLGRAAVAALALAAAPLAAASSTVAEEARPDWVDSARSLAADPLDELQRWWSDRAEPEELLGDIAPIEPDEVEEAPPAPVMGRIAVSPLPGEE